MSLIFGPSACANKGTHTCTVAGRDPSPLARHTQRRYEDAVCTVFYSTQVRPHDAPSQLTPYSLSSDSFEGGGRNGRKGDYITSISHDREWGQANST